MTGHQFRAPPDSLNETEFMSQFGGVYEHSPWVAASIWDQGLGPEDAWLSHFAARIIAVRGLDRAAILAAFEARIDNDPATEFATARAEVHKIARLRLELLCG